jgi:DNA repair protein RadC
MTIPIADLPCGQRPRERMQMLGAEALSDAELLALLLRHGRSGESALDMAGGLLAAYGGLSRLAQARPEELARRPGVGTAKAASVVAAFCLARRVTDSVDAAPELCGASGVAAAARPLLADARRERVVVLVCDARNRVRHRVVAAEGAIDKTAVSIREVLNAVLRYDGRAFAVAHNHPSGDPTPSPADRRATTALTTAARTVGLRFLDHVVVAGDTWARATPTRQQPELPPNPEP